MKKKPTEKAGIVAYRREHDREPSVLVVTSRKFEGSWVFPVGTVKKGESLEAAAQRECVEESGYNVQVGQRLTTVEISDGKRSHRFTFFLATVMGESAHWETDRQREWVPVSKLMDTLPDVFHRVVREVMKRLTGESWHG